MPLGEATESSPVRRPAGSNAVLRRRVGRGRVRGYEAVGQLLADADLRVVFSMLGGTNAPWIADGTARGAFRLVKTRHEATAVAAAAGYARARGTIGICSVTRGPGFANAINSLICAVRTHTPIVMIVGESPSPNEHSAQNIDQHGFTDLIGAGFHHVPTAGALGAAFHAAVRDAHWNGRPQVLSIGDAVLPGEVGTAVVADERVPDRTRPDAAAVSDAIDALERARRPVIIAGMGAVLADCREGLEGLAGLIGAQLATTLLANRFFSGHPADLGLSGGWAAPRTRQELRRADLVLGVGASLNQFTLSHGELFTDAVVIQCDVDPAAIALVAPPDVTLVGDAGLTIELLVAEWQRRRLGRRGAPPTPSRAEIAGSVLEVELDTDPRRGIDPRLAYRLLDQLLPADRVITTDSGRWLSPSLSLIDAPDAQSFIVGRGYGSVGLGIGTAVGAAVARPESKVVLLVGDGGLMMAAQDLDAIRLAGLDVTIVVLNDRQYGAERRPLARFDLPTDVVRQDPPDFVSLARVFGGDGVVVRTDTELSDLRLPPDGLFIVDVRIDPEVDGLHAVGPRGEAPRA
jgi:thiamine pyrophosphate-dependent acetolactate synthase large subunit-like protein